MASFLRIPLLLVLVLNTILIHADIGQAYTWLATQQQSDGRIDSTPSLAHPLQSSVETVLAFDANNSVSGIDRARALAFIATHAELNTEFIARARLVGIETDQQGQPLLERLINHQNSDGGFGSFSGFDSDPLSTSYALRTLFQVGVVNSVTAKGVSYLLSQQHSDGSWSLQDNSKRIELTALVTDALWRYRQHYQLTDQLSKAISYLLSQRDGNLWDNNNIEASALSLLAILNVTVDRSSYSATLAEFSNLQNSSNGSFSDDVYLTALGLRVLDAIEKPAPDEIMLSGRVVDADSGTPLAGAAVQLTGVSSVSQVSDSNGEFELNNLSAGNYRLSVSVDGFGELTLNTLLTLGAKTNLGDLQLSRLQIDPDTGDPVTTGVVRGTITDRRTNAPLSGVVVSVVGAGLSATTNTAGEYQLSAVPSGTVQLKVSFIGYSSASGSANLSAGQTLIFSPSLQEQTPVGVSLQGSITDRLSGSPLAGVQVQVTGGDSQSQTATTDANGIYSIDGIVAGETRIQATFGGYHPVSVTTTIEDGARLVFSPQMDLLSQDPVVAVSGLTGIVIDSVTGRGLQLAQLMLTYDSGESFTEVSGQDGEFTFTGLPQGSATITVELAGYTILSGTLDTQPGLITNIGNIKLQPENVPLSGSLFGQVIDVRSRQAINGAIVSARNTIDNALTETMSNQQGQFTLESLAGGEYEITVSFTDYNSQVFMAVISAGTELDLGEIRLRQPGVDALLADLAIPELDISQVQSSQTDFTISGTVSGVIVNRGNASVSVPFDLVAFEDVNRDGEFTNADTLLGSSSIIFDSETNLDVDSVVTFSIDISGVQSFHDAPITVFVDANNMIAELSEANNTNNTAGLCVNQQQGPSLDLAICMDSSGSVSSSEFQLQLEGTALAIENENIIPRDGSVRVSAIQFSDRSFVELNPTIIEEDNATDVADAIRAITKRGGGTSIHSCIDSASSLISGATPASALQVIDVSTDGESSQGAAVAASNRAADAGIDVLNAIGVGSGVNVSLLESIVFPQPSGGDRGFVITVSNFQEYIDGIAGKIQRETRIPDLTVGGLALTDNGSGASATATLIIGNGGSGDISGEVVIRLYNGSPEQGGQLLVEQNFDNGLLLGESAQVTIEGIVPTDITASELVIEVALKEGLVECNLDNNRQQITVTSLLGDISLSLDGSLFGSNTDIDLETQVTNTGSLEGNYNVTLTILDSSHTEVASVTAFDVSTLLPTESIGFSNLWNTGATISGNYIAQATLFDVKGNVLDTAESNFTISDLVSSDGTPNGNPAATLRASTDRPLYYVNDQVQLDALSNNITTIHPIANPQVQLVVTDASDKVIFNERVDLPSLAPGQLVETGRLLNLVQAAPGDYRYRATLTGDSGVNYASASATFTVINDTRATLRGAVDVQQAELFRGESQSCTLTTINTGTQDLLALPTVYRLVNMDSQQEEDQQATATDLIAGKYIEQLQSFSTAGLALGNYACVLEAIIDNQQHTLAYGQFTLKEQPVKLHSEFKLGTKPRLLVLVDPVETTCTANRSITLKGNFQASLNQRSSVRTIAYGEQHQFKDAERVRFHDFSQGSNDVVNQRSGSPDLAISALSETSITLSLSHPQGLIGEQRIISQGAWGKYRLPQQKIDSETFNLGCGQPLMVGQTVGGFTVVATETIERLVDSTNSQHDNTYEVEIPALNQQHAQLDTLLTQAGYSYTVVDSAQAFADELTSGEYQQYLLLAGKHSLDHWTAKLLREAVNRGEGLIYAGGRAPGPEALWETLGLRKISKTQCCDKPSSLLIQADGVRLLATDLADEQERYFGLKRPLPNVRKDQAQLAAELLNPQGLVNHLYPEKDYPAATLYQYGQGRAVFIAYDILAEITQAADNHQPLLLGSLRYTTPDSLPHWEGAVVPLQLELSNQGSPVTVTASIVWANGSEVIDNLPSATVANTSALWSLLLDTNEQQTVISWAIPAYQNGTSQAVASIYTDTSGTPLLLASHQLALKQVPIEKIQQIQRRIEEKAESLGEGHPQKVALERINQALKRAQDWYQQRDREMQAVEKALHHLLEAAFYLKDSDDEFFQATRLQLDSIIWQWAKELPDDHFSKQSKTE